MLREIVLDTETTGIDHGKGDRVIEIGCVELLNHVPTGKSFHVYINPEYPVSPGAFGVHGLSNEFLADKPVFADVMESFSAFIADAQLVIHNAAFDVGFLNAEFKRIDSPPLVLADCIDALALARRKHPGASNNLDALCSRYGIDNSRRTRHGALLDAEILAEVYIELIGGKQTGLDLTMRPSGRHLPAFQTGTATSGEMRPRPLLSRLTDAEQIAHRAFIETLGPDAIWHRYWGEAKEPRGDVTRA